MPGKHVHFDTNVQYPPTPSPSHSISSLPSSYGPMTPPDNAFAYLPMTVPVVGPPVLHPVLQFTGQTPHPHVYFDVTFPVENIMVQSKLSVQDCATSPPVQSMLLVHPRLLWQIEIRCAPGMRYIRVCDVLKGIYEGLRTGVQGQVYEGLPDGTRQQVSSAFISRWQRMPNPKMQVEERKKGLKRVDWLEQGRVTFAGLRPQNEPNHWLLVLS
ncbi:hypothetical protein FB45DRAFT_866885 [Roridomyces roridus]|uniref:DUF6699 domain-containing protein n=1 Tax=Roridomyces roridus TaxID=1738132 RepID=A0AAD7FP68_9AGAR|nr:hypothetical protein FB45DRAFT_866885 [Roridomyces roridus]